jgi:hypothetical protein
VCVCPPVCVCVCVCVCARAITWLAEAHGSAWNLIKSACDHIGLSVDHGLFACLIVGHTHTHTQLRLQASICHCWPTFTVSGFGSGHIAHACVRVGGGFWCAVVPSPFRHTIQPLPCPVSERGVVSQSVSHPIFCMAMGSPHLEQG